MPRSRVRVPADRKLEAAAIWSSHGLADTGTTTLAYFVLGQQAEANPLIAFLMSIHIGLAALAMLGLAAGVAIVYIAAAELMDLSPTYALVVSTLGVLVAVGNLAAVWLAVA